MTSHKKGFLEEEWRKMGPYRDPRWADTKGPAPHVWHIVAYGRKAWPEGVLVAIVMGEPEADLMILDHELGQRVGMVVNSRNEAVAKIQPPEEALVAVPH